MAKQFNEVTVARLLTLLRHMSKTLPMLCAEHPKHTSDDDLFECVVNHVKGWRDEGDLGFPITDEEIRVGCDAYACMIWEQWEVSEYERRQRHGI